MIVAFQEYKDLRTKKRRRELVLYIYEVRFSLREVLRCLGVYLNVEVEEVGMMDDARFESWSHRGYFIRKKNGLRNVRNTPQTVWQEQKEACAVRSHMGRDIE